MKRQLLVLTTTFCSFFASAQMNPDFSPNHDVSLCGPTDVYFVCASPSNPDNIWWDFGDGTTGTGINPVHRYTTTGVYSVKMIAQKGNIKDSITKVDFVTLNPKPVATYTVEHSEVKKPYQRKFRFTGFSNADSISQYTWIVNGVTIQNKSSFVFTFPSNGVYATSLKVVNNRGCSDEFMDSIVINDEPEWPTSVNDISSSNQLTVANSLTDQLIYISREGQLDEEADITISDIMGRIVQKEKMGKGENTLAIQTDQLSPGTYIIESRNKVLSAVKKFDKIRL